MVIVEIFLCSDFSFVSSENSLIIFPKSYSQYGEYFSVRNLRH